MIEEWKDIEGYEGKYQVSNFGNIKALEKKVKKWNGFAIKKEKIIRQHDNGRGYKNVCLYKGNEQKRVYVHRLVAEAFILNTENKTQVNHINEIKNDNRVDNLEWVTPKENMNHGSVGKKISEKLSKKIKQLSLDGHLICIWKSISEAKSLGYDATCIVRCCKGKVKTHKKYKWEYV